MVSVNNIQEPPHKVKKNGRPPGSLGKTTIKSQAVKVLQEIMVDTTASHEARAIAASKLIDIIES